MRRGRDWLVCLLAAVISLAACQPRASNKNQNPTPAAGVTASQPAALEVMTAGVLTVTITSPADETVVNVPQVVVLGRAPAEAVITVNDSVVVVGATGQFSTTVPLQEGPNEIDVVASDVDGNEASTQLVVTFDPQG